MIQSDIIVSPVDNKQDLEQAYHCVSEAFGRQVKDAIWIAMNPGWDTDHGQAKNALKMIKQWKSTKPNKDGQPNAVYLKPLCQTLMSQASGGL